MHAADLEAAEAGGTTFAPALAAAGLTGGGFRYLTKLGRLAAGGPLTAAEWADAIAVLTAAHKSTLVAGWRTEEAAVTLSRTCSCWPIPVRWSTRTGWTGGRGPTGKPCCAAGSPSGRTSSRPRRRRSRPPSGPRCRCCGTPCSPDRGIRATLYSNGISRVGTGRDGTFGDVLVRHDPTVVALTSPVNATGVFELDVQADMLLPFEGSVVDTTWELRLPPAANPFDLRNVMDVMITVDYTALHDETYRGQLVTVLNGDRQRGADGVFSLARDSRTSGTT